VWAVGAAPVVFQVTVPEEPLVVPMLFPSTLNLNEETPLVQVALADIDICVPTACAGGGDIVKLSTEQVGFETGCEVGCGAGGDVGAVGAETFIPQSGDAPDCSLFEFIALACQECPPDDQEPESVQQITLPVDPASIHGLM